MLAILMPTRSKPYPGVVFVRRRCVIIVRSTIVLLKWQQNIVLYLSRTLEKMIVQNIWKRCEEHRNIAVEVYCVDRSKLYCTLCATLSHRKCDSVISIEAAAAGIRDKTDTNELLEIIEEDENVLRNIYKIEVKIWLALRPISTKYRQTYT